MFRHIFRHKNCLQIPKKHLKFRILGYSTQGSEDSGRVLNSSSESLNKNFSDKSKDVRRPDEEPGDWRIRPQRLEDIPSHCDVLVIGGGAMGSSVAYWLRQRVRDGLKVVVVERDPTYSESSTTLSVGGLRQQFSVAENIEMSLFGSEFIRNINEYLGIPGEPPIDINFHPCGYLLLASEAGAETLCNNSKLQNSLGAKNVILTPTKLKEMFPWLNTSDIAAGCLGLEKEGWFDPWCLLSAFKKRAISLGVEYVKAEVVSFSAEETCQFIDLDPSIKDQYTHRILREVTVRTENGEEKNIAFCIVVNAAGAFSGHIARLAGIGTGDKLMSVQLPVEPRKRYVYCYHCPEETGINTPLTVDPTGTYFRKEDLAGNYICGLSPSPEEEPSVDNLDVDHEYFNEKLWPKLAHRAKAFENIKMKSSWAGYYEYNTFDENGIIGPHPYYGNFYLATGFSGHGIQQAPAVGRAISELIIDSTFLTIDLSKFGFERLVKIEPMRETNIV